MEYRLRPKTSKTCKQGRERKHLRSDGVDPLQHSKDTHANHSQVEEEPSAKKANQSKNGNWINSWQGEVKDAAQWLESKDFQDMFQESQEKVNGHNCVRCRICSVNVKAFNHEIRKHSLSREHKGKLKDNPVVEIPLEEEARRAERLMFDLFKRRKWPVSVQESFYNFVEAFAPCSEVATILCQQKKLMSFATDSDSDD
uniref:Uncharacterized protein n=2 Tax=Cuerna arida TaxID=1464854 RepID=A0A1B6FZV7_9HEMI